MLDAIENSTDDSLINSTTKQGLSLSLPQIPEIQIDNTDRNRTSPFAFTGNRFEFRAVGSEANTATAMIVLNTAMAQQLRHFQADVDKLLGEGHELQQAILSVLRGYIRECKPIRFEGNGYSEEWKAEALRRGLDCETSCPLIFDAYLKKESVAMFEEVGVMTLPELQARNEVKWDTYTKKIQIEARVLGDLAVNHIIPIATEYQHRLAEGVRNMTKVLGREEAEQLCADQLRIIREIAGHTTEISELSYQLVGARKVANQIESEREKAIAYHDTVESLFDPIRRHIDKLELIVDDRLWTLPKYRELLEI